MKAGQLILLGEALGAVGVAPFVKEPLLQVACLIIGAVSAYSAFYLKERQGLHAVGYLLSLGAVALFVLGETPLLRFAGWEGVSLAAWLLIAYGRQNTQRSLEAAFIGFIINRLGDAVWIASLLSWDWKWGFVLGGWVKAALFPFSFWLVQVMYAPIPVSALLHSALLVALGVYGPMQNPEWLEGLPLRGLQKGAELAALASAIGAFLSRVPKTTLAWTTTAHLALTASLWPTPNLAQQTLFTHAYFKAALFLTLGLVQKSCSWNYSTKITWLIGVFFLELGAGDFSPMGLAAETLTAFTLARFWSAYPTTPHSPPSPLLLSPIFLIGLGTTYEIQKGLHWEVEKIIPLLATAIGLWTPWPKKSYRIDAAFLHFFANLEKAWNALALYGQKIETTFLSIYDNLFVGVLRFMRYLSKEESHLIEQVWRPILRRFRYGLVSWLKTPFTEDAAYLAHLQWAFLLSLLIVVLWKYFF